MAQISNELKKKKDNEAKQLWTSIPPSAKWCKTCKFRLPDTEFTTGYQKCNCLVFESPDDKPMDVLWDGSDCDFYTEDKA